MQKKKNKQSIALLFISLSLSLPHYLSLYLSTSLSITLSLSNPYISLSPSLTLKLILEITGPQYLLNIGGDRGPIETIHLSVRKYISDILGVAACHTHQVDTNGNFVFIFLASK